MLVFYCFFKIKRRLKGEAMDSKDLRDTINPHDDERRQREKREKTAREDFEKKTKKPSNKKIIIDGGL